MVVVVWAYDESMGKLVLSILILLVLLVVYMRRKYSPSIYLIDYACIKEEDENKATIERLIYFSGELKTITMKDILFQIKVFLKSGIGEEAYVPRSNLMKGHSMGLQDYYEQADILVVGAVEKVLRKTGMSPQLIDVLVVNSGMFNPTPSLTSLLIHRFKMRADVKSFHLSGMGCSASLIAIGVAKDLLCVHGPRGARFALVASTEVLGSLYDGKQRSMMVTNCLFRSAGNALLLSNRRLPAAKLQLSHLLRVNTAAHDDAHHAVVVKEDDDGVFGAQLSPHLIDVATKAIDVNLTKLAPKVLPLRELAIAAFNHLQRHVPFKMKGVKAYVPNFKLAFHHFCIHPGSKAVIEGVGKSLGLSDYDIEPSLMALHRFGNTSCSGIWYELAYIEAKKRLKAGDKVWQIGLGSGFKCNSAVWKVLRTLDGPIFEANPWHDCIDRYPIREDLSKVPHVTHLLSTLPKT